MIPFKQKKITPTKNKNQVQLIFYIDSTKLELYLLFMFVLSMANTNLQNHRNPKYLLYNYLM